MKHENARIIYMKIKNQVFQCNIKIQSKIYKRVKTHDLRRILTEEIFTTGRIKKFCDTNFQVLLIVCDKNFLLTITATLFRSIDRIGTTRRAINKVSLVAKD